MDLSKYCINLFNIIFCSVFQPDEASYAPKNIMITGGAGFM